MILTIKAFSCSEDTFVSFGTSHFCIDTDAGGMVSVNYKMRDTFKFLVNGGLTIKYLSFNALDSIITPTQDTTSTKCL